MTDGDFAASRPLLREFVERFMVRVQHTVFGPGPDSVPFGPWYGYDQAAAAADIWNAGHPDSEFTAVVTRLYEREQLWQHNPFVAMEQAS